MVIVEGNNDECTGEQWLLQRGTMVIVDGNTHLSLRPGHDYRVGYHGRCSLKSAREFLRLVACACPLLPFLSGSMCALQAREGGGKGGRGGREMDGGRGRQCGMGVHWDVRACGCACACVRALRLR